MQLLVLWGFAKVGRLPQEIALAEAEIKTRPKGGHLSYVPSSQNSDDGLSHELFSMSEMMQAYRFMGGWIDNMRELLLNWTEDLLNLVLSVKAYEKT